MTSTSDDPVERLERAARDRQRAGERVASFEDGEATLRTLSEACDELRALLAEYEERATGDGDFAAFIEFQEEVARFTERLDEDLPERAVFEDVDDLLQQRRLTDGDFERARARIADAEDALEPLEALADARERYDAARRDVRHRLEEVRDRIDRLERLQELGEADLTAPVERLRGPIDAYDDHVREAFGQFRSSAPAREVLDLVATTAHFPLVPFRDPPEDLLSFVRDHEAGTEPVPQLLEYADYSRSKLDHYVADPDALKRAVATQATYLRRLDAEPLTVGWPPPERRVLRWACREKISVVDRFAPGVLEDLRAVRELTRRDDYERLRTSAVARDQLSESERERVASGAVAEELAETRDERERLESALEDYTER